MSQTLTTQSTAKASGSTTGKKRRSSQSMRRTNDPNVIERRLSQQVQRSDEAVNQLVDEILCTGEKIVGGIQDALDDLMGYDTEYAQFLLQRDEAERKRVEAQEEARKNETPLQRQQRLMREARMAARKRVRNELYRDDRTPIEKIRDAVKAINYRQACKKLDQYGLLAKPWQGCTLICLFVMMMATNMAVFGKGVDIQSAPSSYTAYCTHCNHKFEIARTQFEEFSFYDVHPQDFELQYHKKLPTYPSCPECNVVHQKLILVSRPDRDDRFLLATNPYFKMPIDQTGMEDLCKKYQ
jgi:hypothetical protein